VAAVVKERLKSPRARLFVALDLPDQAREGIVAWGREALADPALRPVAPESLHITLAFLGYRPEKEIEEIAEVRVDVLDEEEEGRFAFIGATKSLGHPVEGTVAVVDVGGGSSEVIYGTVPDGVTEVKSFKIGSGSLTEDHLESDPPSAAEIRGLRDHIADFFEEVELGHPEQAVAVGGSATSLRTLVGAVLEYETLERAVRVLSSDEIYEVAKRFELDSRRVKLLPAGVLLLERFSQMLGQPLQIGKGGLREGIILTLLNGNENGSQEKLAA
jgi:exopolyphosphatase/guanosine-5'-triphosphate,3'-diphosphate pyrophosphatase